MTRAALVFASLASLGAIAALPTACANEDPPAADVCGEAKNRFSSCGTSLPLFSDGPCTGTTRIVARCVVDHAHDCDELATLFVRIDACVADLLDGGDELLPPATDLPVPPRDAGDGGSDDSRNDEDAVPRPVDASAVDGAAGDSGTEVRP
jgi:hypothetical protein